MAKENWGGFVAFVIATVVVYSAGKYLDARGGQFNSWGEVALFLCLLFVAFKLFKE